MEAVMQHKHRPAVTLARDLLVLYAVAVALVVVLAACSRPLFGGPNCQTNLRELGFVCKMFSTENDGFFPDLSSRPGFLSMMHMAEGYKHPLNPGYVSEPFLLFCPQSECWRSQKGKVSGTAQQQLDDSSYVYLGYVVKNEAELETFYECYKQRVAAGLPFNEDLPAPPGRGSGGGDKLLRLRDGAEKVYITDAADLAASAIAQSEIPVFFERPGNHEPSGVNVLYLDGHVEFIRYPGEWPATPRTFEIVAAIEALRNKLLGQ
jgi:prepilin-type processing-associated H-X9-DG protein